MAQPVVAITYANNSLSPLSDLKKEDEGVHNALQTRAAIQPFRIIRESFISRPQLVTLLTTPSDRDNLLILSYSGHAGKDSLVTQDEATNANGMASLLSQCPNLKLIVLNGCSTWQQVKLIFAAFRQQNRQAPIVVATSAKVDDPAAMEFGITFFQQLFLYSSSVEAAFQTALGAVKTRSQAQSIQVDETNGRGAFELETGSEGEKWGLYTQEEGDERTERLRWALSRALTRSVDTTPYEPNKELFQRLIYALSESNPRIRDRLDSDDQEIYDFKSYDDELLKSFPHPISVQLRKLRAVQSEKDTDEKSFYDRPGENRLWQLLRAYQTAIDILAAIAQAEFWNCLTNATSISPEAAQLLTDMQQAIPIPAHQQIQRICQCLGFYAETYTANVVEISQPDTWLPTVLPIGDYFEGLKTTIQNLSGSDAIDACRMADNQLATLLERIVFLSFYKLISVKSISLIRNRAVSSPRYEHEYYQYWETYLDPILRKTQPEAFFMDNASVLVQKKSDNTNVYLNVTPFLIDENAFQEKATLSNLFTWRTIKRGGAELVYQPLLRFDDVKLTLMDADPRTATPEQRQASKLYQKMKANSRPTLH